MSKKKIYHRHLKKGKYYWHYDDSTKGKHPSLIYKKNDKKNRYHVVCFTTSEGKGRKLLNKNIDPKSKEPCYVLNRPRIAKRKTFSSELVGFKITDKQDKARVRRIENKKK